MRKDDLKLINGIGPTVEKRLFDDGIYTFAHLAAFLPGDIAAKLTGLPGMSAKRIIREDWIGQASKLAAESILSEAHTDFGPTALLSASTEHLKVTTSCEEPHNVAMEPKSNEVQVGFEARADFELADKLQAPVRQTPPIELTNYVTPLEEPQKDTETMALKEKFHPATFTIELHLDENHYVHSAHVIHVESKRGHSWTGWPNTELVDFLRDSVELNIPSDKPATANAEEPEQVPALITENESPTSVAAKPVLAGTLHLRDMIILTAGSSEPRRLLPHDQPFDVSLTLDLSELTVPGNTSLDYKAVIYRKSRNDPSGQIVVETEGTIEPADNVTIDATGNLLVVGSYRLSATVVLELQGTKPTPNSECIAVIEGSRIRVY